MRYYICANRKFGKFSNEALTAESPFELTKVSDFLWEFRSDEDFFSVARATHSALGSKFYYLVIPEFDSEESFLCHSNHGYMNFGLDRLKDEGGWGLDLILTSASTVLERLEGRIQNSQNK